MFICYLAYLLLSLLKLKLKKIDISPIDALKEVETYYKVYLRETNKKLSFSKSVSLSKKQELIIKAVDSKLLKTYCIKSLWNSGIDNKINLTGSIHRDVVTFLGHMKTDTPDWKNLAKTAGIPEINGIEILQLLQDVYLHS